MFQPGTPLNAQYADVQDLLQDVTEVRVLPRQRLWVYMWRRFSHQPRHATRVVPWRCSPVQAYHTRVEKLEALHSQLHQLWEELGPEFSVDREVGEVTSHRVPRALALC